MVTCDDFHLMMTIVVVYPPKGLVEFNKIK